MVLLRRSDGTWSDPVFLRDGPDGTYLFFASNGDIYWVSMKIIDSL